MTAYNNPQRPIEPYIAEVTQAVQEAGGGLSDIYRIQDEQIRGIDVYPAPGTTSCDSVDGGTLVGCSAVEGCRELI